MSTLGAKTLGALGQQLGKEAAKHILAKAGIKDSLEAMSEKLTDIQDSINRLTAQVGSGLLDIRKDLLEKTVIKITHPFNSVNLVIEQSLATTDKNDMTNCHARLTELLKDCRKDVSEALFTLDQKLSSTERGNITRAAIDQAWTDSTDFVSFLLKMKAFIEPLWLAEAQALLLMQMATQDPNVIYPEGQSIINKYDGDKGKLSVQEAVFEGMVGSSTIRLYDALVASPDGRIPITFQTFSNVTPTTKQWEMKMFGISLPPMPQACLSGPTSVQWELVCQDSLRQPNPNKSYLFGIGFKSEDGNLVYLSSGGAMKDIHEGMNPLRNFAIL